MKIQYVVGDATYPISNLGDDNFIVHCCNDIGGWGAGFVLALSKKWKAPEKAYRNMKSWPLGTIEVVPVDDSTNTFVVNLIGQRGIGMGSNGIPPIRYEAIEEGFNNLIDYIDDEQNGVYTKPVIHMPRIGCGLAGGEWSKIEEIINRTFIASNIQVVVYDLA